MDPFKPSEMMMNPLLIKSQNSVITGSIGETIERDLIRVDRRLNKEIAGWK